MLVFEHDLTMDVLLENDLMMLMECAWAVNIISALYSSFIVAAVHVKLCWTIKIEIWTTRGLHLFNFPNRMWPTGIKQLAHQSIVSDKLVAHQVNKDCSVSICSYGLLQHGSYTGPLGAAVVTANSTNWSASISTDCSHHQLCSCKVQMFAGGEKWIPTTVTKKSCKGELQKWRRASPSQQKHQNLRARRAEQPSC